ncbi:hypothetical protein [Eleftheria terrae]|uniref:hypothetical protein n=1 Tax=Eleftheria terrae TaxID=1597781 RepID=UPI00263B4840|nr:hypothetical protein [Eleftheria terrae]WKB55967.1 hypothetical protein N7L95_28255 [Eleftheria terrae]
MSTHLSAALARTKLAANQGHSCTVAGCGRRRSGFHSLCNHHKDKARLYGDPLGKPVHAQEYQDLILQVRELFDSQPDHLCLVASLKAVTAWTAEAAAASGRGQEPFPGAEEVARVLRHGVQPREFLVVLCAFLVFAGQQSQRFAGRQAEDFALSHALFKLAPRPRKFTRNGESSSSIPPKFAALKHVGRYLRQLLAPLAALTRMAVEARDQQKQELQDGMRQPFVAPVVALLKEAQQTIQP